jgi:hypothetical protein
MPLQLVNAEQFRPKWLFLDDGSAVAHRLPVAAGASKHSIHSRNRQTQTSHIPF